MAKVLVTGGLGFIGSNIVDAYVDKGYEVVVVDNLSTGRMENLNPRAKLYVVDILDDKMEEIFRLEKPEIVNHHAAQISVPFSVRNPLSDLEVNIKGTVKLLELSRKFGVEKFIFASSGGALYGDARKVPTDESYPPNPVSPYGISKFSAEKYICYYGLQFGLKYLILRYSNIYGPRQISKAEAGVVSIFMEKLSKGERPVLYHYPEQEKGMIRDYCFVGDVVRANLTATISDISGIYNIGTGIGTYTIELYQKILEAFKKQGVRVLQDLSEPERAPARPGEVKVSILDVEKARKELDWKPNYSLEEGIYKTLRWHLAGHHKGSW